MQNTPSFGTYLSQPVTKKGQVSGHNHELSFVAMDMQGWRSTMEDAFCYNITLPNNDSVFAVFDGHGGILTFHSGSEVARFTAKHFVFQLTQNARYQKGEYQKALDETFKRLDELLGSPYGTEELQRIRLKSQNDKENLKVKQGPIVMTTGCTANVVLVTANAYYVANAGDSRTVLCKAGKAIPLSIDHKLTVEKEAKRVQKAGGKIDNGRINGGVNLTRSIGDFLYKSDKTKPYDEQLVICKPEITVTNRSSQDQFLVVGCDGIWDIFGANNQGLISLVKDSLNETHNLSKTVNFVLDKLLAPSATPPQPGTDNMSMILIYLRKP